MYASLKKRVNNAQANAPAGRAILICMYWNALFSCTPLVIHYHFCRNADLVSGMTRQRWEARSCWPCPGESRGLRAGNTFIDHRWPLRRTILLIK